MKITSGIYKYRNIEVPKSARPTTGKVREAVFSMITAWIPGASVLDLFAGSGAMGLEALSRGADHCIFCETDRKTLRILDGNIRSCGAGESCEVIGKDFRAAISSIAADARDAAAFDIVILDPPYAETGYYGEAIEALLQTGLLGEESVVVAEHLYDNKLPETYACMKRIREKKYGNIGVDLYIMENDASGQ